MSSKTITQPPSRAGLVLTPITDRNGRKTSVWRKPLNIANAQLDIIMPKSQNVSSLSDSLYYSTLGDHTFKTNPWGDIASVDEIKAGIHRAVTNEGVVAFKLSPQRESEVDPKWNLSKDGWYGMDGAEWAVIPHTFDTEFSPEEVGAAEEILRDWYPREYEAVTGEIVYEEESYTLSAEAFDAAHTTEFIAESSEPGVFDGEVIVTAGRAEDGEEAQFIVSEQELEDDGELPKGHRKVIDEEKHPRTNPEAERLKRELKDAIKLALVNKWPRMRYAISTYNVTKATLSGLNKKRDADAEDEYIGKDYGLRAAANGFMSQLVVEIVNSSNYVPDPDVEQARQIRKYHRSQRRRAWMRKIVG